MINNIINGEGGLSVRDKLNSAIDKLNILGEWDSTVTYNVNNFITYNGYIYKCVVTSTNEQPNTSANWEILQSGGSGSNYINSDAVPQTLGGITAGATFDAPGKTMQEMFDLLLYPYQVPNIINFELDSAISRDVGAYLVGDTAPSNTYAFNWIISNDVNLVSNTTKIENISDSIVYGQDLSNTSPHSFTVTDIQKNTASTVQFRISCTDTHSTIHMRNKNYSWYYRTYYGTSPLTTLTSSDVINLSNSLLSSSSSGTRTFNAGDYKYIAIPSSLPQPSSFVDADTGFAVAMEAPYTVTVTNAYGIDYQCEVYRTTNTLAGTLTIIIS